jgi:DNA-binding response OmpR family regulator
MRPLPIFPHPLAARSPLMSMKLLLVDDDLLVCSALSRSLVRLGHASRTETSVAGALALLEGEAPSAVLTDLDLGPGGNGIDLITELRRRGYARPAILMTGSDVGQARARLAHAGHDDVVVLEKPFEIDALLAALGQSAPAPTTAAARRASVDMPVDSVMGNVMRALSGRAS